MSNPDLFPLHQRVIKTCPDGHGRIAVIAGKPHVVAGVKIIDVIPEGSSKGVPESWPVSSIEPLPRAEQLEKLGGNFKPPKGYPMTAPPRRRHALEDS